MTIWPDTGGQHHLRASNSFQESFIDPTLKKILTTQKICCGLQQVLALSFTLIATVTHLIIIRQPKGNGQQTNDLIIKCILYQFKGSA